MIGHIVQDAPDDVSPASQFALLIRVPAALTIECLFLLEGFGKSRFDLVPCAAGAKFPPHLPIDKPRRRLWMNEGANGVEKDRVDSCRRMRCTHEFAIVKEKKYLPGRIS